MAMAGRWGMNWGATIWGATLTTRTPFKKMADADRLRLLQWLSPAFPIGAFAYSQGLEAAIAVGDVRDAESLEGWIASVLSHGSGRLDAVFLVLARAQAADFPALAELCRAMASSSERLAEMNEQGRAFGQTIAAITGIPQPALPYALAVGHATLALRVETAEVLMLWLQNLAAQLTSVAVRFVPLGQTEGQQVLARLAPLIAGLAEAYAVLGPDDLYNTTPGADLAAMRHETMDVRIYRT